MPGAMADRAALQGISAPFAVVVGGSDGLSNRRGARIGREVRSAMAANL